MRFLGQNPQGLLFWSPQAERTWQVLELVFPGATIKYLGNGIFAVILG